MPLKNISLFLPEEYRTDHTQHLVSYLFGVADARPGDKLIQSQVENALTGIFKANALENRWVHPSFCPVVLEWTAGKMQSGLFSQVLASTGLCVSNVEAVANTLSREAQQDAPNWDRWYASYRVPPWY